MKKLKIKDDQPYKVSKEFIRWLDGQIKIMDSNKYIFSLWEQLDNKITKDAYSFIRSVVKS